jgi:abhydrolase domain-containing protein 6
MVSDRLLLKILRFRQQYRARARYRTIVDTTGRTWPIYYTRAFPSGGTPGVPVVFFHGFGNDGSTWLPLFALLGENRELIGVDLPGFGGHEVPEDGFSDTSVYTPRWYAKTCGILIQDLAVRWGQPPILVGKSMGGMIAGLVACEIPDLCRALVLIDPSGVEAPRESPFWGEFAAGRNVLLPTDEAEWDTMVRTLYEQRRRIPGFVRRTALQHIKNNSALLDHIFKRLLSEGMNPLGKRLKEIRCPVQIIWGERDQVIDKSTVEVFRDQVADVRTTIIEDCGHSPTTEQPERVRDIILDVFSRYG